MNIPVQDTIEDRLAKVIQAQQAADEAYASIEKEYPEVWEKLQAIESARTMAEQEKQAIKEELIKRKDFDTKQVEGYNISVSRIVKLAPTTPIRIAERYKKTEVVFDVKKAQEDFTVTGELPAGFEDKSVYRLNWKEVKNV